uniref:Uncharacterized protein MANES_05G015800 n=1 Tax=Rhizophora mucronata TaxID=61149 RepID=A0A2P2NMM8_RHIMU
MCVLKAFGFRFSWQVQIDNVTGDTTFKLQSLNLGFCLWHVNVRIPSILKVLKFQECLKVWFFEVEKWWGFYTLKHLKKRHCVI